MTTCTLSPLVLQGRRDLNLLRDEFLHDLFLETAVKYPDNIAAVCESRAITYAEMDELSNHLAAALQKKGMRPKDVIGICMSRSIDLHIAILGVLKAGCAYLPFDFDTPVQRIAECLMDCQSKIIIVEAATQQKFGILSQEVLLFQELIELQDLNDLRSIVGISPENPAYLIYTSGSTGKPKGVVVTHRNICHFLRSVNTIYEIQEQDVVFQGASVAFDLSLEEIFLTYLVGATSWIATSKSLQETDRLCKVLEQAGITVLDTVPTLISMLNEDIPSLRTIIFGGEVCPPELIARWSSPGRRLFNSYGPTEATVVTTIASLHAEEKVTIGYPIPNAHCYVVNEEMQLLGQGQIGELLIAGPGVAKGYWNRPDLNALKFISNPFDQDDLYSMIYRTGDAVKVDDEGRIQFCGRIDDQVKLRGFRIELGEIESWLSQYPDISQVAVAVRKEALEDKLVAFIVLKGQTMHVESCQAYLKQHMPAYMIPTHYEILSSLPKLFSGKLDRKRLQNIELTQVKYQKQEEPLTKTEYELLKAAQVIFPAQNIPLQADFFTDMGGHSLMAARFVSILRANPLLVDLTMHDIYAHRTLRAIAADLDSRRSQKNIEDTKVRSFLPPSLFKRLVCGVAQAFVIPILLTLGLFPWLSVLIALMLFSEMGLIYEVGALFVVYACANLCNITIAIVGKWLVVQRTKPGRYPIWGIYYYRWWLSNQFINLIPFEWFQSSPFMGWILSALGAKIGTKTNISAFEAGSIDLLSIGHHSVISTQVQFANAEVVGNELVIGEIKIGNDVHIGTSCVLSYDVILNEGVELHELTGVMSHTEISAWEIWEGSPARQVGRVDRSKLPEEAKVSSIRQVLLASVYFALYILLPPVTLLPILPSFYVFELISHFSDMYISTSYWLLPVMAWPTAMTLIVVTISLVVLLRWIILPRVSPGTFSIYSGFYLRKWMIGLVSDLTLETLSSLYSTVYMCIWYRLMGAKIGKDVEISTNLSGRFALIEIGEKSFIADSVVLGEEDIRRGWLFLKPVKTAEKVFVGNSAVITAGTILPKNSLIGVKSRGPSSDISIEEGDVWFGSPPLKLPSRQKIEEANHFTYQPSRKRRFGRALFEAFTVSLPTMLLIIFAIFFMEVIEEPVINRNFGTISVLFIGAGFVISMSCFLISVFIKWIIMGKYRPMMKPLWSWWAIRTEATTVIYTRMAGDTVLNVFKGTPILPWLMRLYGAKFGKGVYLNTTDFTEFDCVKIGDYASINTLTTLQTHLYEDRVMKIGRINIGRGATVGSGSTILYDTSLGDYTHIGPLTVVMKGEEIPGHSRWQGAPAQPYLHFKK